MIPDEAFTIGEIYVVLMFFYIFLSCEEDEYVAEPIAKHFQVGKEQRLERPLSFE